MADAINAGLDPHLDMAASMLGIDYDEAKRRKKADDPQIAEYRQLSKALNFGYPGGLGRSKFVEYARAGYGVVLSEAEAGRRKEEWYRKWPEMRLYHQMFGNLTLGDATFDLVQPGSGRVRGKVGFCDGSNSVFQGRAADGAKRAGWYLAQECYLGFSKLWPDDGRPRSPLYGSRPVLFVHDEFILEVPIATAHEATLRQSEVMVAGMKEVVPDVKVGTEYAVAVRWYKGASAVYDENKRLMPWEPKKK
jgi:DNA polymerase-1